MPAPHRLLSPRAPWVQVLPLTPGQTAAEVLKPPASLAALTVSGPACTTKEHLLRELARCLSFPDYFDPNWDALEECLCDLEWFPADGYVLLVERAHEVLRQEPEEQRTWFSILRSTGNYWATQSPPRAFHTILVVAKYAPSSYKDWRIPLWKER